MLSFIFMISCGLFELMRICGGFFYRLFIYVLLLEIQLPGQEGWNLINRFNPATILCLSQASTRISNVICCGVFIVFSEWRWGVIVWGIVDHPSLNFRSIKELTLLRHLYNNYEPLSSKAFSQFHFEFCIG